ncbi:MAG: DUF3857 domain-containing protein [Candidatus Delongbacteria bacterium]
MLRWIIVWGVGLAALGAPRLAAEELPKFGKVTAEELQLTSVPEDPEADAVCLFDRGEARIVQRDRGFKVETYRQVRIKILTERGKEAASVRVPFWHEDHLFDVDAYCLAPDGTKTRLKAADVHEEPGEEFKSVQFAVPGAQVGSVLEYRYQLNSDHVRTLDPWEFRGPWTTLRSQFSLVLYPGFRYNIHLKNMPELQPEVRAVLLTDGGSGSCLTWTATRLAPLRPEPQLRNLVDQGSALLVELVSYQDGYQFLDFSSSWTTIVKEFQENEQRLDKLGARRLDELLAAHCQGCPTARDTLLALHGFVSRRLASSQRGRIYERAPLSQLLEQSVGTEIEKNVLFCDLLRRAGYPARPLLISTRDHGTVWENMVAAWQFNHLLVQLELDGQALVLDTASPHCPLDLLPEDKLVERGLLVDEGEGRFLSLKPPASISMLHVQSEAWLDSLGDLHASSLLRHEGYHALRARVALEQQPEAEFVQAALAGWFGQAECDSFRFETRDSPAEPLLLSVHYRVPGFAQRAGGQFYLPVPTLNRLSANPFPDPERRYPVDFPCRLTWSDDLTLHWPAGWSLTQTPPAARLQCGGLKLLAAAEAGAQSLHIQRHYQQTQLSYGVLEYPKLRQFYDQVVAADQGGLVLQRTAAR